MSFLPAHLRTVVRKCAQSPAFVEDFNHRYNLHLSCPIEKLLADEWPPDTSLTEAMQIGMFVAYIQLMLHGQSASDTQE